MRRSGSRRAAAGEGRQCTGRGVVAMAAWGWWDGGGALRDLGGEVHQANVAEADRLRDRGDRRAVGRGEREHE